MIELCSVLMLLFYQIKKSVTHIMHNGMECFFSVPEIFR